MGFFANLGRYLTGRLPWYEMPRFLAVRRLISMRRDLREMNLHDTEEPPLESQDPAKTPESARRYRTVDGAYNDLRYPRMGSAGTRFGRNFPLKNVFPDKDNLLEPNPREVSLELMTRHQFQPVPILNLLAASWIQFQVHDWFAHKRKPAGSPDSYEIPLKDNDTWPDRPMRVPPTEVDPPKVPGSSRPPAYANQNPQWWDGSQIYGLSIEEQNRLRTFEDGKLKVNRDGKLLLNPDTGIDLTGFIDNWWVGLSMLHGLFTLEHNAICDRLKQEFKDWDDERLFQQARLINVALMAKIHTVEWTTSIITHPVVVEAMNVNWYGALGEKAQEALPFLDNSELLGGIVGSKADHHAAPYSLTEEFVAVYRMHPLMPDDFTFLSVTSGEVLETLPLPELAGRKSRAVLERHSMQNLFYSFGRMHPGAIRLHNYPRHLQFLKRDDGETLDLAAVDILRDRERGVPRYNDFRRLLRKDPVQKFEDLTDVPEWAEQIRRVYNGDIEKVDLQVGLMAEPLPKGFGFSETAFRIFVLMASRRLKSDRFFTDDYRPEVYTKPGLDWIRENSMLKILRRNYPELAPALEGLKSAFEPWKKLGS
jgi:hypothetical protein